MPTLPHLTELPYLWHNVPASMRGACLWPLKALGEVEPEIAAVARAKYTGREHIADLHVPILECAWDEIIFLSPIHPQHIADTMHAAGTPLRQPMRAFQIPANALSAHEAVWFNPQKGGPMGEITLESLTPFDHKTYQSQPLCTETLPYYTQCAHLGRRPLLLGKDMHVLVRGFTREGVANPLSVEGAEIVETITHGLGRGR